MHLHRCQLLVLLLRIVVVVVVVVDIFKKKKFEEKKLSNAQRVLKANPNNSLQLLHSGSAEGRAKDVPTSKLVNTLDFYVFCNGSLL